MPDFLTSVVYTSTSFLLGVILVNQIVDFDLLYVNPMPANAVSNAFTYYQTWWDAPVGVKALLHLAAFAPIGSLIIKLNAWTESAIFFDGSALALEIATVILYLTVHIPSLRTFLPPSVKDHTKWNFLPASPPPEVPYSITDKTDAVRVLAAGNALVAMCLIGVIGMQAGQEWARRTEEREQRLMDEKAEREAERIKKDL
ncbi:Shr3 amino acid permease chaperone [Mrakia frigida]|uniref:Shr3 amino acid permease chaperone n=1 Tax=Mrakia frigida TaxID=29902 RepID=UPI003FCBF105